MIPNPCGENTTNIPINYSTKKQGQTPGADATQDTHSISEFLDLRPSCDLNSRFLMTHTLGHNIEGVNGWVLNTHMEYIDGAPGYKFQRSSGRITVDTWEVTQWIGDIIFILSNKKKTLSNLYFTVISMHLILIRL